MLAALAFLTKQTALVAVLPIMVCTLLTDRRRSIPFVTTTIVLAGASRFVLERIHGGFYSYYTVDLPRHHELVKKYLLSFWTNELFLPLSIALILAVLYFYVQHVRGRRSDFLFYLCAGIGMIGAVIFPGANIY